MKIKCKYDRAHGYLDSQRNQIMELDGVVIDGTVDTRQVLEQLDFSVIDEWVQERLAEMDAIADHRSERQSVGMSITF
ncbi:hypothetical protein [Shimwellia blattae]|uniref:Uncharacterized protein n=1 Tax=Shimwellia blattae (strain ATCC 29907 / DSM 4481 / JCM 1650 / NBRC 105725 / CDC 9005-74) TaxID=630626 RepID=I2B9U4_SHIBC|nr:hypothetical protein [Shimwellia blattae]AFJ47298.1 hypothetical protein EBL_c22070 [Shimwellia blattae DSM 4481 = NBRC 105725]GAB80507.1 hypothetical protein EB105725_05_02350 [Shimwellia blattae DSM 4481 = NBRC 105725]VDY64791.1 Uncharacterised protein [Shimwellia blattae]VEC22890.1 Uncharacterised protein [Shimwellia blattae]